MKCESEHTGGDVAARLMRRRTLLKLPLLATAVPLLTQMPTAAAEPGRWTADRANRWYKEQGWLVGTNYVASNAVNQLEMFQADTFDPLLINRELRWAKLVGFNTVRVFLHDQLWTQDRAGFQRRLAHFVAIAAHHRIKPLFVLFDSCWDPRPRAGLQRAPRPWVHNSGWVQSPGADRLGDRAYIGVLQDYVEGVIGQFRTDSRVLGWDLWNEPDNPAYQYRAVERPDKLPLIAGLLPQVFRWARSVDADQPLTSGVWDGVWGDPTKRSVIAGIQLDNSDVMSFHSYDKPADFEGRINELTPWGRPILCTEYLARTMGNTVEAILPITLRRNVAAYNWGFVAGKTQTIYPWDSWDRPYPNGPGEWFHDLMHADGSPYRDNEVRMIRWLTTDRHFQMRNKPGPAAPR